MEFGAFGFLMAVLVARGACNPAPLPGRLPDMPGKCSGAAYCTEPHPNYPQPLVDELLQEYRVSLGHPHADFNGRDGFDLEKQMDCKNTHTYVKIYEITDENDNVRVVAQAERFEQQVRLETCDNPGPLTQRTKHFNENDVSKHDISCEDNYMSYSFVVLSLDGNSLESVSSKQVIPVYCACRLKIKLN